MKVWTRIRAARRVRWRRWFRRLLPPVARSDGWRRYGGGELRVSVDELVLLLVWTKEKYLRELRRRGKVPAQGRERGMVCTHRIPRRGRAFIGVARGRNRQGSKGN
jgi:hypothetical protein